MAPGLSQLRYSEWVWRGPALYSCQWVPSLPHPSLEAFLASPFLQSRCVGYRLGWSWVTPRPAWPWYCACYRAQG